MAEKLSGYELSRGWFDFCFENPEKVSPNHTAIFFFAIEHCNRLGWKEKFGFPTQMAMDALGIKKHQTYIKYFNELCDWGFLNLIQKSANQYSANIISLPRAMPKKGKALDKAIINHAAKQTQTNGQSNSSIDKPDNQSNQEQDNSTSPEQTYTIEECLVIALKDARWTKANKATKEDLEKFNTILEKRAVYVKNPKDYKTHFANYTATGKLDTGPPVISMKPNDEKARKILGLD